MITIDKHVPVPAVALTRSAKYPFRAMEVGDSFYVPRTNEAELSMLVNRMRMNMNNAARRLKFKFVIAVEGNGVRVWRTE